MTTEETVTLTPLRAKEIIDLSFNDFLSNVETFMANISRMGAQLNPEVLPAVVLGKKLVGWCEDPNTAPNDIIESWNKAAMALGFIPKHNDPFVHLYQMPEVLLLAVAAESQPTGLQRLLLSFAHDKLAALGVYLPTASLRDLAAYRYLTSDLAVLTQGGTLFRRGGSDDLRIHPVAGCQKTLAGEPTLQAAIPALVEKAGAAYRQRLQVLQKVPVYTH